MRSDEQRELEERELHEEWMRQERLAYERVMQGVVWEGLRRNDDEKSRAEFLSILTRKNSEHTHDGTTD